MPTKAEIEAAARALHALAFPWERLPDDAKNDYLVAAKAALEAAERVRWQSIETAPKDGDLILCASSPTEVRMSTGRWAEGYWL